MNFAESGKMKAVTFSYDDGITQDIRLIELLNKYNLKSTFNINSGKLGTRGILHQEGMRISHYRIQSADVKYVYDGHEVAVHTLTHPLLPKLDDEEIIRQVEQDRLNLSDLVEYDVVGMAYPGGGVNNDERTAEIIRENTGVKYCRTIARNNCFAPQNNLYRFHPSAYHLVFDELINLGQQFIELDATEPAIFYIWGHSYELDFRSDYWIRLEQFFSLISERSDIYYGTNREILLCQPEIAIR